MEDHDLPRRSRDYDLRAVVYLTRSVTSAEEAVNSVARQDVINALAGSQAALQVEEDD